MASDAEYAAVETDADIVAWSKQYCRTVRQQWRVDVRFDLVTWEISHHAKRRAAALKRPTLPDATVGEACDWDTVAGPTGGRYRDCKLVRERDRYRSDCCGAALTVK